MNANEKKLSENQYPGRGIVVGLTPDGRSLVQVYWIMGRSENSRNRVFIQEGNNVRTRAHIESKMKDPSLIIYYPLRTLGDVHVVTNGDQTDTVADYIAKGKSFEEALLTRCFEPDAPNYTPRISAATYYRGGESMFKLSILKTVDNNPEIGAREFYEYEKPIAGEGYCIHTYAGDGDPLPSFAGAPYVVTLADSIDENAERYWGMLNEDNRVSLLVKHISVDTGESTIRIINRFDN